MAQTRVPTILIMSYQALLFCPEEKTAQVVTQILNELQFTVETCNEPFAAVKKLMAQHFDAIVVDCDSEQNAALLFKSAHNSGTNQASLAVAVVEGQAGVAKAFRIGANLVLTKPINVEQSKSTLRVARGLLRKTEAPKSAPTADSSANATAANAGHSRAVGPETYAAKTVFPSVAVPKAPLVASPAATSAFEVEQDPAPAPDAAEVAFLESMTDPTPVMKNHGAPMTPSLDPANRAWPPSSRAATPVANATSTRPATAGLALEQQKAGALPTNTEARSYISSMALASGGAAAAAAPAKEKPRQAVVEPHSHIAAMPARSVTPPTAEISGDSAEFDAPMLSSLATAEEVSDAGGSKNTLLIAAVAVIVLAAYFGWTRMHPSASTSASPSQVLAVPGPAVAQPSAVNAPPDAVPQPSVPSATVSPKSSATANATAGQPEKLGLIGQPTQQNTSIPKTTPTASADGKPSPILTKQEPIVVKTESHVPASPMPSAPAPDELAEPPAPGSLEMASNNGNGTAISHLVNANSAAVPPVPQTLRLSQGISQGLLVKSVAPIYPAAAKQMGREGAVQLEATIDKSGSITAVKPVNGDSLLVRAAMDAVKQWKYKPYLLDGQPVEVRTQVTVNFKLH